VDLVTDLVRWHVTLNSGAVLTVWADGYSVTDEGHVFGVLAEVPVHEQVRYTVMGRTPTNPDRVAIALAVIPTDLVAEVRSG
jgi:hypothetical protein